MIPEQAIILCAGLGTRLGRISKKIPKAMLPLLDSRLIDLQIEYLNKQGIKNIFVNTHHFAEDLEKHIKNNHPQVRILHEKVLLGSGGAFHNLLREGVTGNILALNADTLYFTQKKLFEIFQNTDHHQLLSMSCEESSSYNRLETNDDNQLIGISPPEDKKSQITFSGMSIINLNKLEYTSGPSSFFSSVCVPGNKNVSVIQKFGNYEFYDFGTIQDYAVSFKRLISQIANGQGLWMEYFPRWSQQSHLVNREQIILKMLPNYSEALDLSKNDLLHSPS